MQVHGVVLGGVGGRGRGVGVCVSVVLLRDCGRVDAFIFCLSKIKTLLFSFLSMTMMIKTEMMLHPKLVVLMIISKNTPKKR